MVDVEYKCEQTNFDTVLTYAKLDLWAKFQDFQVRIKRHRQAPGAGPHHDRFNDVKRAKTSNRVANPLRRTLTRLAAEGPRRYMIVMGSTTKKDGTTTADPVKVGKRRRICQPGCTGDGCRQ
jgi:hypothetical protein